MSSDIQETADGLRNYVTADRKTEVAEIGWAGRSLSADRPVRGVEVPLVERKPKGKTWRARAEACCRSALGILVTLTAVLLVSLLFFSQSVASSFARKS